MVDTPRSVTYLTGTAFRDGQSVGSITPQALRDFIVTVVPAGQTLTSGASVAMTATLLLVNKTSGSATAVTLPSSPVTFTQTYTVKDQKGDAGTNNITVTPSSGLIDGQSSFVMNVNYEAVSFVFDGANWSVI